MNADVLQSVLVSRDPETRSGDAVFVGTRVPADTLVDYLEGDTRWMSSWITSPPSSVSRPSLSWRF